MARVKKEEDYSVKRNEILDVAQRMIYSRGYEQMSIQDICSALQISKGAFYHYFDSKPDLLNALIDRTQVEGMRLLQPLLEDPNLTAIEKLQRYFSSVASWKTARKDYLMALLRVWYADENAVVRQKSFSAGLERITPLLNKVIEQGKAEGLFDVTRAEQAGQVILTTMVGLGDTIAQLMLKLEQEGVDRFAVMHQMSATADAYNNALERILGAPSGVFNLFDDATMRAWIMPEEGNSDQVVQAEKINGGKEINQT